MSTHNLNRILHPHIQNFTQDLGFSISGINDCFLCPDALQRSEDRYIGIFGSRPSCRGVADDIIAACAALAVLDAKRGAPTVININAAPRGTKVQSLVAEKPANGTPFGFVRFGGTLITSTLKGYELSLVKKFFGLKKLCLLDIPAVMEYMVKLGRVSEDHAEHVCNTQFRSFEFQPDVAAWLWAKEELPFTEVSADTIPDMPRIVWKIDNFGNCCTTLHRSEVSELDGQIATKWGALPYYKRLADVPSGRVAVVSGSSGFGFGPRNRFLEIMVGGMGRASEKLDIKVGETVL